jgi:hypothetical protein
MANYQLSELNRPVDDAGRQRLIRPFEPLTTAEKDILLARLDKQDVTDPQQVRAAAVQSIGNVVVRDAISAATKATLVSVDDLGYLRVFPYLDETLLFHVIAKTPGQQLKTDDAPQIAAAAGQDFRDVRAPLYQDRLAVILEKCDLQIEEYAMERIYRHLAGDKVHLDSPNLPSRMFEFLEQRVPATPKPGSVLTKPVRGQERLKIFLDLDKVLGTSSDAAIKQAVGKDITNPLKLRAIAIEAAVPKHKLRELTRTIRATVSLDGGSTHLRGFPLLPEGILYQFLVDRKKTLVDLCKEENGCELKAFSESYFRSQKDELYKNRIRESLTARGFAIDEQRLESTYQNMLRQRIPLPVQPQKGAIR